MPVWSLLNRAAKLYAFGYLEWEFFTMAQHQATMALEASLKALYMRGRAVPLRILVRNGQNAVVEEREFPQGLNPHRAVAQQVEELRKAHRSSASANHRVLVDGAPFPAKKTELAQWALQQEWISANEHRVLLAQLRRRAIGSAKSMNPWRLAPGPSIGCGRGTKFRPVCCGNRRMKNHPGGRTDSSGTRNDNQCAQMVRCV